MMQLKMLLVDGAFVGFRWEHRMLSTVYKKHLLNNAHDPIPGKTLRSLNLGSESTLTPAFCVESVLSWDPKKVPNDE